MTENTLSTATSPYLLQHKDNPVHWRMWGADALADARAADKPILLSIGYAACHWCHVMAHESFENPEIAGLMNDLFINIKVDREERPDIDAIYQQALQALGQHGGWPLTMFLTPDGAPYWGGTYFPPDARYGRAGFPDVLRQMHRVWADDRDKATGNATAIRSALERMAQPATGAVDLSLSLLDQAATQMLRALDPVHGGLNGAPKFPQPAIFDFLWRAYLRGGEPIFRHAVTLTLDRMCQGGIYDHLGGGFARYATDEAWLVPHFEKMLYDNAQLVDLLTEAWRRTGSALYAARVEETIRWVLREMKAPDGGFAASQDADSEGEEGRFYVWSAGEIDAHLGADAGLFKRIYDVTPHGNWDGHTILNRSAHPEFLSDTDEQALARCRVVLHDVREARVKPGWDDKVLTDWNGMMIAALANAGATFGRESWIDAAQTAFDFIATRMASGDHLSHCHRAGRTTAVVFLDDYANMARAALALHAATGLDAYVERARRWCEIVETDFRDPAGGYYFTPAQGETLITRPRRIGDNAVPSGNGLMVGVLARLYHLTGDAIYRDRADAVCRAHAGDLQRNLFGIVTLLGGFEMLAAALQVVVTGPKDDPMRATLAQTVRQHAGPTTVLTVVDPETDLPAGHPAAGKPTTGVATAYLCAGTTCSQPIGDPATLAAVLADPASVLTASP
jgi:uncharacterized protein YyaL (SSP411 family)